MTTAALLQGPGTRRSNLRFGVLNTTFCVTNQDTSVASDVLIGGSILPTPGVAMETGRV